MTTSPSPNGRQAPNCRVLLAAVVMMGSLGLVALVGLVLLQLAGVTPDGFLAGLVGSVAGWLAGLVTPRPRW